MRKIMYNQNKRTKNKKFSVQSKFNMKTSKTSVSDILIFVIKTFLKPGLTFQEKSSTF